MDWPSVSIKVDPVLKARLDTQLEQSGMTLSGWFEALASEASSNSVLPRFRLPVARDLETVPSPEDVMAELNKVDWSFSDTPGDDLTHTLHPYPAKFTPAIPATLIAVLSLPGELVWDPFGGSGTTAVEALVQNRRCLSTDANPLAEIIGKAKTLTLSPEQDGLLSALAYECVTAGNSSGVGLLPEYANGRLKRYVPDIPNIEKWFAEHVIDELAYLKWRISLIQNEGARSVAQCAFSSIVVRVSFQDSETRYAARLREIQPGFALRAFGRELEASLRKLRSAAPYFRMRSARFRTVDLRLLDLGNSDFIQPNSVDLIVTSPPYPNATDYHLYHRFRLFWLGFDPRDLGRVEIGSHLRHQRERTGVEQYLSEMKRCLGRLFEALRHGRYAALLVGDSVYHGRLFNTPLRIADLGEQVGFELIGMIERPLPRHRRSFQPGARRAEHETLLIFRKPDKRVTVTLVPSAYTTWPYEDTLRRKEIEAVATSLGATATGNELQLSASSLPALRRLTFTRLAQGPEVAPQLTWQAVLENGEAAATRKDPKYATHGLHPYKGKFYPQLVKSLFNLAMLKPGAVILDPFVGSGTTTLEAYLNGYIGFGTDVNPLAAEIAEMKTAILELEPGWVQRCLISHAREVHALGHRGLGEPDGLWHPDARKEIDAWFPYPVVRKMAALLEAIRTVPDPVVQRFLRLILSSLLRESSHQDPADLRVRRRAQPLSDAPLIEEYLHRLEDQRSRLQQLAERLEYCPAPRHRATIWVGDTRNVESFHANGLPDGSVDAVITSPPYATALPYIDTDRLSYLVLWGMTADRRRRLERSLIGSREINLTERKHLDQLIQSDRLDKIPSSTARETIHRIFVANNSQPVGFRRRNMAALMYRYFVDMSSCFSVLHRLMKPGAQALIIIGENRTVTGSEEIVIPTADIFTELAVAHGWVVRESIPITVTKEALLNSKNTITQNVILWFEKSMIR